MDHQKGKQVVKLKKQKKLHKKYKINGLIAENEVKIDDISDECFHAIKASKDNYLKSLGMKLIDKATGQKTYWSIRNKSANLLDSRNQYFS